MAITPAKIRLGAPDFQQLTISGVVVDIGSSVGGAEINYNPTVLQIEVDQAIMPVNAYKTKEEITYDVGLAEYQINRVTAAWSYAQSGITTVAAGTLGTSPAPTLSTAGTPGSTSYSYQVVPFVSAGDGVPVTATAIATGAATLTTTNYIHLAWTAVTGAVGYKIIRTASAGSPSSVGLIGTVYYNTLTFDDTGLAATLYTPAGVAPAYPNSDTTFFGDNIFVPQAIFDWSVPKNDGTTNKLRGHLYKVISAKATKIGFYRDKATSIEKLSLTAIADVTQPVGQQAGWIREEY